MDKTIYQIRKALLQDNEWVWWDASKEAYDMHPHATRRIVYAKPAQQDAPTDAAWSLAETVRADLDRQSCPDAYMRIAMESIVKHFAKYAAAQDAERERDKLYADYYRFIRDPLSPATVMLYGVDTGLTGTYLDDEIGQAIEDARAQRAAAQGKPE